MKRHRVRLRPKTRRRRRAAVLLSLGVAVAVFLGVRVARARPWSDWRLPSPRGGWAPKAFRVDVLSFPDAPEPLKPALEAAVPWRPGDPWAPWRPWLEGRRLRKAFPCLAGVRLRRSWLRREVRVETALREPLARWTRGGSSGFIDGEGVVFSGPRGLYAGRPLVPVELGDRSLSEEDGPLAGMLSAVLSPGALPAAPERIVYDASEGGWTLTLADGTRLEWGGSDWTEQKLGRLSEVLADAAPRFGGALTADLRHFEDGKILVRPR